MQEGGYVGDINDWLRDAEDKTDGCRPHFYRGKVLNGPETRKAGRDIFDDCEMVKIYIPGESKLLPDRLVEDEDRARWPKQYAIFKAGAEQRVRGTPLEDWTSNGRAVLSPAQCATYRAVGHIQVVEDIARLSDSGVGVLGPNGYKLREAAQAFTAPLPASEAEMREKLAEQAREMAAMKAQLAQLTGGGASPVTPATSPPPAEKRPVGRPPNAKAA